jgi:hypothetical protein
LGTAIHTAIEDALADNGGRYLLEHEVKLDGLPPAHIDLFDTITGEVVDWKTIKMSGVDFFVTQQKRWQVQVYGYLMAKSGFDVRTVTLYGIPRDGTERNIIRHSEPYDEATALEALAWLEDVRSRDEAPEPERDPVTFCKNYCDFYGELCQGNLRSKTVAGTPITDETVTKAAKVYLDIVAKEKALTAEKEAAKAALEGYNGVTFEGVQVTWSEVAGRSTPDTDAISKALGTVPMKQGNSYNKLTVSKGK